MTSQELQDLDRNLAGGYSSESLDMLKSREGQMNAIFACYGSAAQQGQLLEKALGDLVLSLSQVSGHRISRADLSSEEKKIRRKTLGQLLGHFDKYVRKSDESVRDLLGTALEKRNFLVHRYFLERDRGFKRLSGRMKMLNELIAIGNTLEQAAVLSRAMRHALIEQSGGEAPGNDGNGDTLFTFSVDINKGARQIPPRRASDAE